MSITRSSRPIAVPCILLKSTTVCGSVPILPIPSPFALRGPPNFGEVSLIKLIFDTFKTRRLTGSPVSSLIVIGIISTVSSKVS